MIIKPIIQKIKRNKKGQEAIEIALMFPIMAMLMLTTFDIGQILKASWEAKQLARIGVRTAVMTGSVIPSGGGTVQGVNKQMDMASALETIATTYNHQHKNEKDPRITLSSRENKATNGILFTSDDAMWASKGNADFAPSPDNIKAQKYNRIRCEVCMDVKLMLPLTSLYSKTDGNIYTTCQTYNSHHSAYYNSQS